MRRAAALIAAAFIVAAPAAGAAAHAQDIPQVLSPLMVAPDHNGVNLTTGRIAIDVPVLAVPGAPNLRFDRVQNVAPYVSGRIQNQGVEPGYDRRSYSVHSGAASSDSFQCIDFDCESIAGSGSTFIANSRTYRQAGSGAVYHFNLKHVHTTGANAQLLYYASNAIYPNGETIAYSYQTAALAGDYLNRTFYRPVTIASNLGYFISLTYQASDFNGDPAGWGRVAQATLYAGAAPNIPLGRLTYSGTTITDLGGRVYTCADCANGLGLAPEVAAGTIQLPGDAAPATQIVSHPNVPVVAAVTRDAVEWTYAYASLHQDAYGNRLYDQLSVAGPNGFSAVHAVGQYIISPASGIIPPSYGNLILGTTDPIGRSTSYHYDEFHRVDRIVFPELNEIRIGYDGRGNIDWRIAKAKPGSGLADIVETAEFPTDTCLGVLCYRPSWSRDALGRQTDYAYNSLGQLTEQTDPADANGIRRKTYIAYENSTGLSRRSVVRICGDTTTCGTSAEIRTEYDYWGSTFLPGVERRIDAAAGVTLETHYTYDSAGRLLSTDGPLAGSDDAVHNRYDVHGRKTWEIGALAPNGLRIARRFTYRDSDDRPLSIETGTLPDATSDSLTLFNRTDLAYDGRRNPVRETVSAGGTTHSVVDKSYDDSGRLICSTVRMNPAAFASLPNDACAAGPQGGDGVDRIARILYDAAGQRLQLREGVGSEVEAAEASWAYNANGQVTTVIDGNGNRAELHYDGHGRQDRWTFPSTTRPSAFNDATQASALATAGAVNAEDYEQYGYDAAGNRTSLRKRDGSLLTYTYDALGRMIVKQVPERPAGPQALTAAQTRDVYYSYDLRNLQLSARFDSPSGEGVTNVYDGFGRLASSVFNMGGIPRTLGYTYDAAGNRTSLTYPDNVAFGLAYDALGRPTNLFGAVFIGYGDDGQPNGISRANGIMTWFGYDGARRLSSLRHFPTAPGDVYWAFGYNPAGQIAGIGRENDAYAWTGHYAVNRAYATNGLNQYTAAGGATFAYDANGNLISDGSRSYVYDIENRLVSATPLPGVAGSPAALVYDPLGRLFQVSNPIVGVTRFLYDGDALVVEYNGGHFMARRHLHWPGADRPALTFEEGGFDKPVWLHADHQGSIVALSDGNGAATINRYDEYGIPGAGNVGRFQYTGQVWLPELGMYYYKARIYSPTLGRFMQNDPVGYEDDVNLYAYVGNDPVNDVDPEGESRRRAAVGPPTPPQSPSLANPMSHARAVRYQRLLEQQDPHFRTPPSIGPTGAAYRTSEEADYLQGAHAARRATGYYGRESGQPTTAGAGVSRALVDAQFVRTTMSAGRQTYQYSSSNGSATQTLSGIAGSRVTEMPNGTLVARDVNIGNGIRGDFNVHRGSFAGRTGWVLEGQFSASRPGSRIDQVFRIKIEYDRR